METVPVAVEFRLVQSETDSATAKECRRPQSRWLVCSPPLEKYGTHDPGRGHGPAIKLARRASHRGASGPMPSWTPLI